MAENDNVVSTSMLVEEIAAKNRDIRKAHIKAIIDAFVVNATKHLKKGSKVRVSGLGTFNKATRSARKGRNPATGEAIKIKASKSVRFKASATLKASM